jgi:transposase
MHTLVAPDHFDFTSDPAVRPMPVGPLPLVRHAIDELGIREAINRLCPPDPRHVVHDGDCVAVMIMNILAGRVALYDMGRWLEDTDAELLLGHDVPSDAFHDDRLGHTLDRLFFGGTEYIFSEIASAWLRRPEVERSYALNLDTTSVSLEGAYLESPSRPWPEGAPRPARGFSKDHRPDLKQLIFGLTIHGPTRIPLSFNVLDGNTADPRANRFQIESLAALIPKNDDVTLVADCKFVDAPTMGDARGAGFHYVSLLPKTFALRHRLVERLWNERTPLQLVGDYPGRTRADPRKLYHATSSVQPMEVQVGRGPDRELVDHRLVVVRSSTQEEEFDTTIDSRVTKSARKLSAEFEHLSRKDFACKDDLMAAVDEIRGAADYHQVGVEVVGEDVPEKRPKAGRPRKGEAAITHRRWRLLSYQLEQDERAIAKARFHAAHFVLVTDHTDARAWSDQRIFETWRSQQSIEGHAGFRWLKGVAEVAPVFLKLPHRIQALALVFMLTMMVRNWIEAHVRDQLQRTGKKLPNFLDKLIARPTAENIFFLFRSVIVVGTVRDGRVVRRQVHIKNPYAYTVMDLFGLTEELFTRPPPRMIGVVP